MVRLSPATSVPWTGSAAGRSGTFTGTLTLPAPAVRTTVSGVFLQRDGEPVGRGLVKVPVSGRVPGAYVTSGISLSAQPPEPVSPPAVPASFTEPEVLALSALAATPHEVGDAVSIDLTEIFPAAPGQEFFVTGLAPGLSVHRLTGLISGTILAENPGVPGLLTVRLAGVSRSIPFHLTVLPYSLRGSYEVLVENGGEPVGKAKLTVTGPRAWSATLHLLGQPARSARGTAVAETTQVVFPSLPALSLPVTGLSFTLSPASDLVSGSVFVGSFAGSSLRGFRLARPGREPAVPVTATFLTSLPDPVDHDLLPAGAGHATGTGDGRGLLPLRGQLGDAVPFTAALNVSQTAQAVVFLQPYRDKASSFFGGILDLGDLALPARGASPDSTPAGLLWRKADDPADLEPAYPDGFGLDAPLAVTAEIGPWKPMPSAEALALALGLDLRELHLGYLAPPTPPAPQTLPDRLSLRPGFTLVRLSPATSVPWTGSAAGRSGTFTGTLTLPAPAVRTTVSGVFLQRDGEPVGRGLVKIPVTGRVPGAYVTSGISLRSQP
jgi:hypothetical protein